MEAYLKLVGEKQGEIRGSCDLPGHLGEIEVFSANHEVAIPAGSITGSSVGRPVFQPFVITKEVDRSTPLLYRAMTTGEVISSWELECYRPNAAGVMSLLYTIQLHKARIAKIHFAIPNVWDRALASFHEYEEIMFVSQSIEWTWVPEKLVSTGHLIGIPQP